MTSVRSRSLIALVAMVALAACKKEGGDASDLPADLRPHPAQGDPSKLPVPALFASIPADTPYLVASLDGAPPELWAKMKQAFQPLIDKAVAQGRAKASQRAAQADSGGAGGAEAPGGAEGPGGPGGPGGPDKVLEAVMSEMTGKWNQAGLESLGFSAQPRFAIYGLGLQLAVARLVVKDGKAVRATIERIAARAGKQLPPAQAQGGRSYWQHADPDGTTVVISIADNELVLAVGKADDVAAKLGLILGVDKPARNMADGALVKQLMGRHGFGGQLIGFADTRQLAGKGVEAAGAAPSPACNAELDRLSAKLPHLVVGYSELSTARIAGGFVVELAPELVTEMQALRTEIPGLGAALGGHPLFALAAAIDLPRAQQLAAAAAGNLQQLGTACGLGSLVDSAASAARELARPLPDPVGRISGGAMVFNDLTFGAGPGGRRARMPEKIDGVLLVASPDAKGLFGKTAELDPQVKRLGIEVDGKLHDLHIPMQLPFAVSAGVGERLIVATAGDQGRPLGDKLLGAHASGKAPLFVASYEFGKLMELAQRSSNLGPVANDPAFQAFMSGITGMFGRVASTLDVTDHGLAFLGTLELK